MVLQADSSLTTLAGFRRRRAHRAERGLPGQGAKRHGRKGADLVLSVPVGTLVRRRGETEIVADVVEAGQKVVVARGGKGGRGNARFATATRQAPRIAERGQKGEEVSLVLDLKLLSDVGIVGLPNAGKSTLLRRVSAARPKVADYPFTTLEPALGVVEVGYDAFVMADLPGIIEGAHRGAGLGHQFLRHVERTLVLIHLLDGSRPDPVADLDTLAAEMGAYSAELASKRRLVAVNKVDLPEVRRRQASLSAALAERGFEPQFISGATGEGVDELLKRVLTVLGEEKDRRAAEAPAVPEQVLRPLGRQHRFAIAKVDGTYTVEGEGPVAVVEMLGLESDEAREEVLRRLGRMGVISALRRAGVRRGDRVQFGSVVMEWQE